MSSRLERIKTGRPDNTVFLRDVTAAAEAHFSRGHVKAARAVYEEAAFEFASAGNDLQASVCRELGRVIANRAAKAKRAAKRLAAAQAA